MFFNIKLYRIITVSYMIITGKILKDLRLEAGISQQEVARLAGITQAHVAKIETERVDPRISTVNKIISILREREIGIRCRNIMSKNIISAKLDESIEKVIKIMRSFNVSQIPVFHGKRLVGSIHEGTIMRNFDRKLKLLKVRHILDKPFPMVNADDTIEILPSLLDFHPAVLVSNKGKVSGIITKSDLLSIK